MGRYKDRVSESETLEQYINKHKSIKQSLKQANQLRKSLQTEISDLKSAVSTEGDIEDIAEVEKLETFFNSLYKTNGPQI